MAKGMLILSACRLQLRSSALMPICFKSGGKSAAPEASSVMTRATAARVMQMCNIASMDFKRTPDTCAAAAVAAMASAYSRTLGAAASTNLWRGDGGAMKMVHNARVNGRPHTCGRAANGQLQMRRALKCAHA